MFIFRYLLYYIFSKIYMQNYLPLKSNIMYVRAHFPNNFRTANDHLTIIYKSLGRYDHCAKLRRGGECSFATSGKRASRD